jgi:hypothetical protein
MTKTAVEARVAARYLLQREIRRIASTRVASAYAARVRAELTPTVMMAFVDHVPLRNVRVAVGLTQRLKQMWDVFTSKQGAWDQFKTMIGVKATDLFGVLKELPSKIKSMMAEAKRYLAHLGEKMTSSIPALDIYIHGAAKLPALGEWLKEAAKKIPPAIGRALTAIGTKAHSLADWIDGLIKQYPVVKPASVLVSAAVYAYIWFNVTEISWDVPEIIRGFLGQYSFVEILHSLPESGVGLIIGLMFPGLPSKFIFNALLPITVALRVAWLVAHKYGKWDGKTFKPDATAMGLPPELATP